MTEPVAGLSAMRPRDDEVGGLPMPRPPAEKYLRTYDQRRTIVVWMMMTVGFLALYSIKPDMMFVVGTSMAALVAWIGAVVWRVKKFQRANADAIALLNARKFDDANEAFMKLAKSAPSQITRALAAYNVAATAIRRGDGERALSILGGLWRAKMHTATGAHQLREQVPLLMATLYAQLGDVDAAERWLAAARKVGKHPAFAHTRNDVVAESTILMRRAQYAAAAALLAEHWRAIEESTPAGIMRNTRILRAFSLERAGGSPTEVEQLVAGCRPFEPGEYEPLAKNWPEMHAFLATRSLL